MKNITRLTVAIFVAIITAFSINFAALAVSGSYSISDDNGLWHDGGVLVAPTFFNNSSCRNASNLFGAGSACAFRYGSKTSVSSYRWAKTKAHTYKIYAYDPTIGKSVAKYTWRDINEWPLTVNQASPSWRGRWVYIGFSDYVTKNTGGYLILSNDCSGWTCGKKVLWDSMQYTTNP